MVLKTAILSEKYATDYNWYVDVVLQLIRIAGDYVSDEVWHRVVQVISRISPFLERILMEHIDSICSLDSELFFISICSVRIRHRKWPKSAVN